MEAAKVGITGIFNKANKLKIPHFQRAYVWEVEQWERFLEDMRYASGELNNPYFLGSIILKQEMSPIQQQGKIRTIIDGQQRLTTIALFFKALFIKNSTPERFSEIFNTYWNEITIEHNHLDKAVFEKILLGNELEENEKDSKVFKCFEYFLKNIQPNEMDANNVLANLLFVGIDLQSDEDEQQIFDTINSLGVRLTTAELLKNFLFKEDEESYNINWKSVFEEDEEVKEYWDQEVTSGRAIRHNIDLFLQSYLFIKIQEPGLNVSSQDKLRYFRVDSIFNSYNEFINKYQVPVNLIIEELKEYAQIYKGIINPKIVGEDFNKENALDRLNLIMFGLDTTTIIPYVLYLSKNITNTNERNQIFKYLESYLMRRIICRVTTKNYNKLFNESMINKEINSVEKLRVIIAKQEDKNNYMPQDEDINKGFNESWLSNKQSRGILYLLEKTIRRDNMQATNLKPLSEYSVEHIMPKKWRNNWNQIQLSEEEAKDRDRILLTLGNLTLITKQLNSSIRDSNWESKKKGSDGHNGLVEFTKGIETFSEYLNKNNWSEVDIKERAQKLAELALSVWKI